MSDKITVTKKDLQIFRGTYAECMAESTVDMKIYLAWDTQQIFVGNASGGKTPYSGRTDKQLDKFFTNIKGDILNEIEEIIDRKLNDHDNYLKYRREKALNAWAIYVGNVSYGIITETSAIHDAMIDWFSKCLNNEKEAIENIPQSILKYM